MATETMSDEVEMQETFQDLIKKEDFVHWTKTALHFNKGRKAFLKEIEEKFREYISNLPTEERSHLYQFFKCCQENKVEHIKIHQNKNTRKQKRVWECKHSLCATIFAKLLSLYSTDQTKHWVINKSSSSSQKRQKTAKDETIHPNVNNTEQQKEEGKSIDKENVDDASKPSESTKESEHCTSDETVTTGRSNVNTFEESKQAAYQSNTNESGHNGNGTPAKQTDGPQIEEQDTANLEEYAEFTCMEDYWKMARLFVYIDPGNEDVNADSPDGLDLSLVVKLMRNCKLFEFDGSAERFQDVINDRNEMMHSAKNEVSEDTMHNIFKHTSDLLKEMKSPACQKLLVEMPIFETQKFVTGTSSEKFMYLAEKALRMQTAALKFEVAARPNRQREEELEALLRRTSRRLDTVNKMTTSSTRQQLEGKIRRLKKTNDMLQKEANWLNYRVKYLEKQTSSQSQQQLREEVQKLRAQVFQDGEKQKMQTELDTLRNESKQLNESNKSLQTENDRLQKDLICLPTQIKDLQAERDALKVEIGTKMKELQNERDLYLDQKNEMTEENAMLKDQIGQIKGQKDKEYERLNEQLKICYEVLDLYDTGATTEMDFNAFSRELERLNSKLQIKRPVAGMLRRIIVVRTNSCTIS